MFAAKKKTKWYLRQRVLELGEQTRVMGIMNVTPDSFSDGGLYDTTARAVDRGLALLEEGADILDIGGESTRPGKYQPLTEVEEQDRILPVVEELLRIRPDTVISVDTFHAMTARAAIAAGAEIINDVSGFLWDKEMASTCGELGCGVVLMHTRGTPDQWSTLPRLQKDQVLPLIRENLKGRLQAAISAGVTAEHIVLDPGYGFGKSFEESFSLLAAQAELCSLGRPLLAGVSRKSFLGKVLNKIYPGRDIPPKDRDNATVAAVTAAVLAGADLVRVHNVRPVLEAVRIADAILQGGA
jgi:dihydropteroate synthase